MALLLSTTLLWADRSLLWAQPGRAVELRSPFDTPLTLSGAFGELRATHFHAGLDFRMGGLSGLPVKAVADGYIVRIGVSGASGGFIEVRHDNGLTTVGRHIERFLPGMNERLDSLRRALQSWEGELRFAPEECRVRAGQTIAYGGNTGYSFGPHLHFELIDTHTGRYIDPLPFYKTRIVDTLSPRIQGLRLYAREGEGCVAGRSGFCELPLKDPVVVEAWGKVGAAIKAYDYMNGTTNRYGIHRLRLEVDGTEVFSGSIDSFSPAEGRMVNGWSDEDYMRSFLLPGCELNMLRADSLGRGWVTIDQERDYLFVYTLSDLHGNTVSRRFVVRGRPTTLPTDATPEKYRLAWNKPTLLQEPGMLLMLPAKALYDNLHLQPSYRLGDSAEVAAVYRLHTRSVPLAKAAELRLSLRHRPVADSTKYYAVRIDAKGRKHPMGGRLEGNTLVVPIHRLDTYSVAVDTLPPSIAALPRAKGADAHRKVLRIGDSQSGIAKVTATLNGRYVLTGVPNLVSGLWECRLSPEQAREPAPRRLVVVATDRCGNTARWEQTW